MTVEDLETHTKALCTPDQYRRKLDNFRRVQRSFEMRSEYCDGLPVHLHLEATGVCNLPCPMCPRGRDLIERTGHLPLAVFKHLFSVLGETLCTIVISGWGEPLLNPDTPSMIAHATDNAVPVFLNTNGTLLARQAEQILEAGLTLVNVSVDGAVSRSTHTYTAANPFELVAEGMARLREARDRGGYPGPIIHGQFIVDEATVDEIEQLGRWGFAHGADHVKFKRRHPTMPGEIERSKVISIDRLLQITERRPLSRRNEDVEFSPISCAHPWHSIFLGCTGKLGLCSWDPHQLVILGSGNDDFSGMWNGHQMRRIRRWHSGTEQSIGAPCLTCNRLPGYLHREDAGEEHT